MAKGEILTLGAAAGAIGAAYKLSEFLLKAKRVRDVGPSNAVYVRIIGRVRSDLDEVRRLLSVREVHDALEGNPEKSKWVYGVMRDVRGALENITPHTERVGGDIEAGHRIGVRHRLYWLLSEREKLENREKELNTAHASLGVVLDYLAKLEPIPEPHKPKSPPPQKETHVKETHVDIDIHHEAPQHNTERVEREVFIERNHQAPPRYEEHRDIHYDERGNRSYEERDIHIERTRGDPHGDPRYEAQYDERYEQRDQYERRPQHPEERPFPEPLGRRPESYEDRLPERDSWMQSEARRPRAGANYGPYGEYAEYGAPQPIGAANYKLPFPKEYAEREMWIEQKEDFRFDEYGNRLPDRFFQPPVPRPYRSRM